MHPLDDRCEPSFGAEISDPIRSPIAPHGMPSGLGAEQPVLRAQSLIDHLKLGNAVRCLRIKLAFPAEVFALAAQPLIEAHAEFVQMLPVSGRVQLGPAGGQLHRAFVTSLRALDRRRGQILPRGAAPEVIGAQAHRWTYAVFVSALLRDLHHVSDGIRVWTVMDGVSHTWDPAAGSMRSGGVLGYVVEPLQPGVVPDLLDAAAAWGLFERCVPAAIQDWLSEDHALMAELRARLSGDAEPDSVLSALVASEAPGSQPVRAQLLSPASAVPAATSLVELSATTLQTVITVDTTEFLEDVLPDESALARQFMVWLNQGLLDGSLSVNKPDALVYGVAEGLLLASPRIFREFAKQQVAGPESGADATRRAQRQVLREVLREGWHLRGDHGVNIRCYGYRRSEPGATRINGIVIREPQRFIQRRPAIDSMLVRVVDGASGPG